ncbi:MAG: phosphotransferase [Proteobacteria bacterium]|nr:phosphotransferase [Pseudomonadota bacterium]MDA0951021.1 phosphotransferase [Pseudomonadota bacterium]
MGGDLHESARRKAAGLSIWNGPVEPELLGAGITNVNFKVVDGGEAYVVRIGGDIPEHGISRRSEIASCRAAIGAGVAPQLIHLEPGIQVSRFIEGRTYGEADVREQANLERIVPVLKRLHDEAPRHLRGAAPLFWVFHVLRDYAGRMADDNHRLVASLPRLMALAQDLEDAVGPIRLVFGHNDLLPANIIDDGTRIWLIDWDYAGFNSPLFDLGGLASNNQLSPEQEHWLLETYFGQPPDDDLLHRYGAMKCASLLREAMWSMIQERYSSLDFDYLAYTAENLDRFERALAAWRAAS